jgi:hypothetical protein
VYELEAFEQLEKSIEFHPFVIVLSYIFLLVMEAFVCPFIGHDAKVFHVHVYGLVGSD